MSPDGGTSLHDVSGWFKCSEIFIRKDKKPKTSKTGVTEFLYQFESKKEQDDVHRHPYDMLIGVRRR